MARSVEELRSALGGAIDLAGEFFVSRDEFEALRVEFEDLSDRVSVLDDPIGPTPDLEPVVVDVGGPPPDVDPEDPDIDVLGRRRFVMGDDVSMRRLQLSIDAAASHASVAQVLEVPPAGTSRGWDFAGKLVVPDTVSLSGLPGAPKPVLVKADQATGFSAMVNVIATNDRPGLVPCILSGVHFVGREGSGLADIAVYVAGAVNFQATGNEFDDFGRASIELTAGTNNNGATLGPHQGVIWANAFRCGLNRAGNNGYGVAINGMADNPWPVEPGGSRMVYVEANHFRTPRHATAGNFGARYVARHNVVEGQRKNAHSWDAHGAAHWRVRGSDPIGTRWVEFYRNIVLSNEAGASNSNAGIGLRGGGAVVFENEFQNKIANSGGLVRAIVIKRETGNGQGVGPYPVAWQTGWPGMLLPFDPDWSHQAHVWANTYRGQVVEPFIWTRDSSYFTKGRDYFLRAPAQYQPLAYPHPARPAALAP